MIPIYGCSTKRRTRARICRNRICGVTVKLLRFHLRNQAYRSLVRPCPAAEKNDKKQMKRLTGLVYLDDAMVSVEADRLSAALGHPEPQAGIAFTQLEVAYHTFYKDKAPGYDMFEAALSRNDLNGAKAANAIEQDAAQRFIDRLDAIDWPAQFEGQVNVLRDNLRKLIEFDRRQVDVATTAQIVPPEEGASLLPAVDDAVDSLQNGLNKLRVESNPELQC